jgi:hypothetical protein
MRTRSRASSKRPTSVVVTPPWSYLAVAAAPAAAPAAKKKPASPATR